MIIIGITAALGTSSKMMNLYKGDAKAHKAIVLTIIASTNSDSDPDPLDWGELDSLMSKPPKAVRKPRKAAYKKPQAVKRLR